MHPEICTETADGRGSIEAAAHCLETDEQLMNIHTVCVRVRVCMYTCHKRRHPTRATNAVLRSALQVCTERDIIGDQDTNTPG
jgi:hypothetical protein